MAGVEENSEAGGHPIPFITLHNEVPLLLCDKIKTGKLNTEREQHEIARSIVKTYSV